MATNAYGRMITDAAPELRFNAWLGEHGEIPHKLSRVYGAGATDGADLHQEMLVQLWRSVSNFRGQAQETTWIYRVCLNTAFSWRRDRNRRAARMKIAKEPVEETASAADGPAESHERKERFAALLDAVRSLPPTHRSLVVLALDGLSHREIGDVLGMTENHVGVVLLRARRKLAATLKGVSDEL